MNPRKLLVAVIALLIISWPSYSDAGQGCCSWHGGQSYCDTSVGRWVCSDGTYSPSCGCSYIPPNQTPKDTLQKKSATPLEIECASFNATYYDSFLSCDKNLKELSDTAAEKDERISTQIERINELNKSNESKSTWIFWLGFGLAISSIAYFNKNS